MANIAMNNIAEIVKTFYLTEKQGYHEYNDEVFQSILKNVYEASKLIKDAINDYTNFIIKGMPDKMKLMVKQNDNLLLKVLMSGFHKFVEIHDIELINIDDIEGIAGISYTWKGNDILTIYIFNPSKKFGAAAITLEDPDGDDNLYMLAINIFSMFSGDENEFKQILSHEFRHIEDISNNWVKISREFNQYANSNSPYMLLSYYMDPSEVNAFTHSIYNVMVDILNGIMKYDLPQKYQQYLKECKNINDLLKSPLYLNTSHGRVKNECSMPLLLAMVIYERDNFYSYVKLYNILKTTESFRHYIEPLIKETDVDESLKLKLYLTELYYGLSGLMREKKRLNDYIHVLLKKHPIISSDEGIRRFLLNPIGLELIRRPMHKRINKFMKNMSSCVLDICDGLDESKKYKVDSGIENYALNKNKEE